jgi:outer membrane protein OmpA-like peptidoglycan-associated protein/Tol biopolymer transport system component
MEGVNTPSKARNFFCLLIAAEGKKSEATGKIRNISATEKVKRAEKRLLSIIFYQQDLPYMRLTALILLILPILAFAQSGLPETEDLQQQLSAPDAAPEERAWAYIQLARQHLSPDCPCYQPDSAYHYLREGQRQYRKLSNRELRKAGQLGYDEQQVNQLKQDIREEGLKYYQAKGSSAGVAYYLDNYGRLSHELRTEGTKHFLELRFRELQARSQYDSLKAFAETFAPQLKEYLPSLQPQLERAVFEAFFTTQDSTNLNDLFRLLRDFPDAAPLLDAPISRALSEFPLITKTESILREADHRDLPKTVRVIYLYHYFTGDWGDLIGFQNRYPFYSDSFNLKRAVTVAQLAPDLDLGFTDDRKDAFERYIELGAPTQKAYFALQHYIARDVEAQNWDRALAKVEQFAGYFGEKDERIQQLQQILRAPSEGIAPRSLGDTLNSIDGEYAPVLSADGQRMYFCRNRDGDEDIYFADRSPVGWNDPEPITALNTKSSHEAPLNISPDGNTLLMYDGGVVEYTERTVEGWSPSVPFFPKDRRPDWQGMSAITADGEAVIFAARSIDCIGARNEDNIDLFVAYRQSDGQWGLPINLGTTLNTPFEDRSPFLHPDQRTLYFSSDGHGGFGELDVFVTRRIGDGWTEWSPPVNLGKDINGPGYDWGYRISTDGRTAYFSGFEPGWKEELYEIGVPEAHRPIPVATITGTLTRQSGAPADALLIVNDLETGEEVARVHPDPKTGQYFITLPVGQRYSYTVTGEGLYPIGNHIDLRDATGTLERKENITVPSISEAREAGLSLPLKNLFFETDSHTIDPASYPELNRLAQLVQDYGLTVEIAGHTDNQGGAEYNKALSQRRADAARAYLLKQGCTPAQVEAAGYGLEEPLEDNATAEGRAQNRRVEIRFRE